MPAVFLLFLLLIVTGIVDDDDDEHPRIRRVVLENCEFGIFQVCTALSLHRTWPLLLLIGVSTAWYVWYVWYGVLAS